ncbi:MAG: prefoldin subunit beta [Candidatus Methanomethylicia archaeon]|nr:prefoldin subunit beta [Candidatus Methanomethylicia archaeon]MCX8169033.1 prefoldin subunit beta [Candidatus Methanomethylicia archaeon]MDW7988765.1 prefoldin subunit beta [Nitrososphaerota archaeon]
MEDKLPPEVEEKIARLQDVQEQLRLILIRKQQLQLQLIETQSALEEVEKLSDDCEIYKTSGYIMFKSTKSEVFEGLRDKRDTLELRIKTLEKQESLLRKQFDELKREVDRILSMLPQQSLR